MTGEIKTLYDAGVVADNAFAALNQAMSALIVTLESMDDDGLQPRGKKALPLPSTSPPGSRCTQMHSI